MKYNTKLQGFQNKIKRNEISNYLLNSYNWIKDDSYSENAIFMGEQLQNTYKLTWGMKNSIHGKNIKYFTLYKFFKDEEQANIEINKIAKKFNLKGVFEKYK